MKGIKTLGLPAASKTKSKEAPPPTIVADAPVITQPHFAQNRILAI